MGKGRGGEGRGGEGRGGEGRGGEGRGGEGREASALQLWKLYGEAKSYCIAASRSLSFRHSQYKL